MIHSEKNRRRAMTLLRILAVAGAYYVAADLGLLRQVTVHGAVVTPLWPPTGIALGALLVMGLRVWPGISLGSLLVIATLNGSVSASTALVVAGNTLAPVCAFLLLRSAGFRPELARLRDGVVLVFLGAMTGMAISASTGTAVLLADGKLPASGFWPVWAAWWAGDVMGVLVITPLLLVLRRLRMPRLTDRWVEGTALLVVAVPGTLLATRSSLSMLYLVFPILIWAALRFQLAGSAPCALLISVLAVVAGTDRVGPFEDHTMLEIMVNLTVLNGAVALTALLLAALVAEQQTVRHRIERACEELADLVDQLAPGRSAAAWPSRSRDERQSR
ncbi:MASE1 domain-containing protein [Streptomyces sp. P01-B04]|uniref:MASE1 domain-containing protein n=1 Tax=Streptomyces poriferorum TaxID=2798799 RepID=UPI001C600A9A|nr:MASE1 domain-containing protein [Streptomyces poriferorum]MBW5249699.1 MASE1 domain-containing protein [Streptomyces poriferorum]MBW5256164.1 MASE1 domain-containing protein [Streptomyces poriferorum]